MANVISNLPMPVLNGAGTAVDVSTMGRDKTIVITGDFPGATITVEVSEEAGGAGSYAPIYTFQTGDQTRTIPVAARFMRVNVANRKATVPFSAAADVASDDIGATFAVLTLPANNGAGVAVNCSALGEFKTFVVGGSFAGARILIEVSDDGVDFAPVTMFTSYGGQVSKEIVGTWFRTNVSGRKSTVPFSATVAIGAIVDPTAGGGGAPVPGGSTCYIYQPGGGQTGPGTFDTWADLMTELGVARAAASNGGCYTIQFDDSFTSPAQIPAGGPYDMTNVTWEGDTTAFGAVVEIDDGASFTGLRTFTGLLTVTNNNTVTPAVADLADGDVVFLHGTVLDTVAGGAAFYDATAAGAAATILVQMYEGSQLGNVGNGPVFDVPGAGTTLLITKEGISGFGSGAAVLVGGAAAILTVATSSLQTLPTVYANWAGTVSQPRLDIPPSLVPVPYRAAASAAGTIVSSASQWLRKDASGAPFNQTLPAISAAAGSLSGPGCFELVTERGGGALTLLPAGGDTIEGGASYSVPANGSVLLISDGVSDWSVVAIYNGSTAGAASQSLIYQPGGVETGPSIFNSWTDLMTQLATLRTANNSGGRYTIQFDDSLSSPAQIPAGAYDMTNVTWAGGDLMAAVAIDDGASFTGLRRFAGPLNISNNNVVTPAVTDLVNDDFVIVRHTWLSTVTGGQAFFDAAAIAPGAEVRAYFYEHAALSVTDLGPVFSFPALTTFYIAFDPTSFIASPDGLVGAATSQLNPELASLQLAPTIYTNWAGTVIEPQIDAPPSLLPQPYRIAAATTNFLASFGQWLRFDASGGAIAQTLPAIANAPNGFRAPGCFVLVSESGGGALTIAPAVGDTLQGAGAALTVPPDGSMLLSSDGVSNWTVVASFDPAVAATLTGFTTAVNTGLGIAAGDSITTGVGNTLIGVDAGTAVTIADDVTAVGAGALDANTASGSTAVGSGALGGNSTGTGNTAVGNLALAVVNANNNTAMGSNAGGALGGANNTVVGQSAMASSVTGDDNVAVGNNALTLTTGNNNVGIGSGAADANTSGVGNVAVGRDALGANSTTSNNTAVGFNALLLANAGELTAVGAGALDANTSGTANTAVGRDALGANQTGADSTAVGHNALLLATALTGNTAVGARAGDAITSAGNCTAVGIDALGADQTGDNNTAVGFNALLLTTGANNTVVGSLAGDALTSGGSNVAVGVNALGANQTGSNNVAIGTSALLVSTGSNNVAVGITCCDALTSAQRCTAVGADALGTNQTGNDNTAFGFQALLGATGTNNVGVGSGAGDSISSGTNNVAVGTTALGAVSTTSNSTAVGNSALALNTAAGSTAVGANAGDAITSATGCVAVGQDAVGANQTGADNTGLGWNALLLATGADNTAVGSKAGDAIAGGTGNTAVGRDALGAISANGNATAVGLSALLLNTAADNTAVGANALDANTSGTQNTAVGRNALGAISTNGSCTAVGHSALLAATGANNVAVGATAGDGLTTATDNVAVGFNALGGALTTSGNVGIGSNAGAGLTSGSDNVAIGRNALQTASTTGSNTAVGYTALAGCTGSDNTAVGRNTLANSGNANNGTAVGSGAGGNVSTGSDNTAIGNLAMLTATTGSNNTALGSGADVSANNRTGSIAIGKNTAGASASATVNDGLFFPPAMATIALVAAVTYDTATGQMAPVTSSKRWKTDIVDLADEVDSAKVLELRPVVFTPTQDGARRDRQVGFIAEEVIEHVPQIVPLDQEGLPYTVHYDRVVVLLLAEVKKLRAEVDELRAARGHRPA